MGGGQAREGDARELRSARNQVVFREVNERIKAINESFDHVVPIGDWVCECSDDGCIERIAMTLEEYEEIRRHPARFAVLAGHENASIEQVVARSDRYLTVEKVGPARDVAEAHHPRTR